MKPNAALFWLALVQAVWVEARRSQVQDLGIIIGSAGDATEDISVSASNETNSTMQASGDHTKNHGYLPVSAQQQIGIDLFKPAKHDGLDLCEGEYIGFPSSMGRVDHVCASCTDDDCKCYIFESDMHSWGAGAFTVRKQNHVQRALQCKGKRGPPPYPFGLGGCEAETGMAMMKKVTPCQIRGITCYFKCQIAGNDVYHETYDPHVKKFIMNGNATNEDRCNAYIQHTCHGKFPYSEALAPILLTHDENYLVGKSDMDNLPKWKEPLAQEMSRKMQEAIRAAEAAALAKNLGIAEGELDDETEAWISQKNLSGEEFEELQVALSKGDWAAVRQILQRL